LHVPMLLFACPNAPELLWFFDCTLIDFPFNAAA
jgi:hypothetical protein